MPDYNILTDVEQYPELNVTADRYRTDDRGDLYFFNGTKQSDPVEQINRRHWVKIEEAG